MSNQRTKNGVLAAIAGVGVISGAILIFALPLPGLLKVVIVCAFAVLMERALSDRLRTERRE